MISYMQKWALCSMLSFHLIMWSTCDVLLAQAKSGYVKPDVFIQYGGTHQHVRDSYGDITTLILREINRRKAGEVKNFVKIQAYLSDEGYKELEDFFVDYQPVIDDTPINAMISYNNQFIEVRNLPFWVNSAKKPKGRERERVVIGYRQFTNDRPKLAYIHLDGAAYQSFIERLEALKDKNSHLYECLVTFTKDLENAYNERDIKYLRSVYAEDAEIIVGKKLEVRNVKTPHVRVIRDDLDFITRTTKVYLDSLESKFKRMKKIYVTYDSLNTYRDYEKKNRFGIEFYQIWTSDNYSDSGWVFLYLEIDEKSKGLIYVRIWQPSREWGRRPRVTLADIRKT